MRHVRISVARRTRGVLIGHAAASPAGSVRNARIPAAGRVTQAGSIELAGIVQRSLRFGAIHGRTPYGVGTRPGPGVRGSDRRRNRGRRSRIAESGSRSGCRRRSSARASANRACLHVARLRGSRRSAYGVGALGTRLGRSRLRSGTSRIGKNRGIETDARYGSGLGSVIATYAGCRSGLGSSSAACGTRSPTSVRPGSGFSGTRSPSSEVPRVRHAGVSICRIVLVATRVGRTEDEIAVRTRNRYERVSVAYAFRSHARLAVGESRNRISRPRRREARYGSSGNDAFGYGSSKARGGGISHESGCRSALGYGIISYDERRSRRLYPYDLHITDRPGLSVGRGRCQSIRGSDEGLRRVRGLRVIFEIPGNSRDFEFFGIQLQFRKIGISGRIVRIRFVPLSSGQRGRRGSRNERYRGSRE